MSLELDFFDKGYDVDPEQPCQHDVVHAGRTEELRIRNGYFETDVPVEIVKRTSDLVSFITPYGIDTLTITILDENDEQVSKTFKVVV